MPRVLQVTLWIAGLGILPYLLAVLMPGKRTLGLSVLVVGVGLTALWGLDSVMRGADTRLGGLFVSAFTSVAIAAFGIGVVVRATSLFLRGRGWSFERVFAINTLGFPIVIAVFVVPAAWYEWQRRAPSGTCMNASFQLELAGGHVSVPASRLFSIYLGRSSVHDAYYFQLPQSLREFCDLTRNGARPTRATHISLSLLNTNGFLAVDCADLAFLGDTNACAARPAIRQGRIDDTDYPIEAGLFAPNDVTLGKFLGRRSTYDDSVNRPEMGVEYFSSQRMTPDGKPLTFACTSQTGGYYCQASYAWRDGIQLDFVFRAGRANLVARGERVEATTRAWFERIRAP